MKSTNPACGWDILRVSCAVNPDNSAWWLPSVGRQCLKVNAKELVIDETTDNNHLEVMSVHLLFDPDINFYGGICRNELSNGQMMELDGYYKCSLSVGDEPFQLNVIFNFKLIHMVEVIIASTTVNVLKCSSFSSCGACANTTGCFWCLETVACVRHTSPCATSVNISMTRDQCPRLTSTTVFIQDSDTTVLTENVIIHVINLYKYGKSTGKLRCVVGDEEYAVVVNDSYTHVVCQDVKAPRLDNTKLYLEYDGSRLDNAADVEVYQCNDYSSSCGVCKYHKTKGYKCDWCGSCKTTIDGAPETCKQDRVGQCQPSVSGVYPSAGPEFGGTFVNITGTNIGNRGDTILVTINGVKCENVTVIQPSTVISCITCNGFASTQDGTEVTVNGVISPLARHKYTFQSELELSTFSPSSSIVSGGRKISIQGTKIGFTGSRYNVLFCNNIKCIHCRFIQIEDDNTLTCNMEGSGSFITLTYLTVTIDENTHLRLNNNFMIIADPLVNPLSVDSSSVFRSGGVKLTVTGTGFSNVGVVIIDTPGHGLLQGARPDDYLIRIGLDGLCIIIEINNYNITCLPPGTKPRTNTGDLVFIVVVVGNINEHVGYLRYESATSETNNIVLYGVAGGGIVGVLVIISVVVIMMRRSIKKENRQDKD
ncbi:plexin-2-like isoform X2 [Mytilus galloprovincialis]|uniref:plexin-2-like isoform X2 n=1 Tax=Mytilus galloprovincialis TaxID=29158 RepID=UPI003F7CA820